VTEAALRHGFGELLVARSADGSAAGAAVFLYDNHTAYYLVAANDPAYRNAGVSTFLFLSGVAAGIRRGVRSIDVVGMNSPSRGDFKTSFGAEPIPYFIANWERP
jgi:lipid II:glycine glycyltransferase (peptidoglycan interpeptide bridge formation enzyme)